MELLEAPEQIRLLVLLLLLPAVAALLAGLQQMELADPLLAMAILTALLPLAEAVERLDHQLSLQQR
jgi:hypothetical protein